MIMEWGWGKSSLSFMDVSLFIISHLRFDFPVAEVRKGIAALSFKKSVKIHVTEFEPQWYIRRHENNGL